MNKRKYPYGADMCPQLKVHIGDKQIANGILSSSKMSEIYGQYVCTLSSRTDTYIDFPLYLEKTKRLLFQGSAASFEPTVRSATIDKVPRDSRPSKQLQLTFDGKLFKSDLTNKVFIIHTYLIQCDILFLFDPFKQLQNLSIHNDNQQKCNFCSQTKQLDLCGICKDVFCNMCSFSL